MQNTEKLKFAIKASLSMVLAYLIPLSQGWTQASTAGITVMLIVSTGGVGESLNKGVMRVIGTVIGAVIGMGLIAVFPQDRLLYLLMLSICVSIPLYLVRAYKGDPSIFMLTAMTMMMVFQEGEVDSVFLFGLDKTYMTIFAIIVYSMVGIFLWNDKTKETQSKTNIDPYREEKNYFEEEQKEINISNYALSKLLKIPKQAEILDNPKAFIWGDIEHLKGVLVTFIIFWVATYFWITLNPFGGFMLVALATGLSVLTTFTPVAPSKLMIVFTLSFVFAILMYVGVLPHLRYAWELGLFIFFYSFIAFYFINPKISIFFLLGLFTLGINNVMQYEFSFFLLILLLFYLFLILLNFFYYIPFSTKPEVLFVQIKNRFFSYASCLSENKKGSKIQKYYSRTQLLHSVDKMELWGSQIDTKYFNSIKKEQIEAFVKECKLLGYLTIELYDKHESISKNSLFISLILEDKLENILEKIDVQAYKEQEIIECCEYLFLDRSIRLSSLRIEDLKKIEDFASLSLNRF